MDTQRSQTVYQQWLPSQAIRGLRKHQPQRRNAEWNKHFPSATRYTRLPVEGANEKIRRRFCINGEMVLEDCQLPEDHLLVRDKALKKRRGYGTAGKIAESAQAVGVAQAAFDATASYTREHFQGGSYIIQHQVVAAHLANMATKLETLRWSQQNALRNYARTYGITSSANLCTIPSG